MWDRYKRRPSFLLGFHGCDETTGEAVLAGCSTLRMSDNDYDWLGPGIYFWEGSPHRALEFAQAAIANEPHTTRGEIHKAFVLGAVIDTGCCCDLQTSDALAELSRAFESVSKVAAEAGRAMPDNLYGSDRKARHLDCAVIRAMHQSRAEIGLPKYDAVRGAFWEGGELYPGAGFSSKQHVQIAVLDPKAILGYFRPL